MSKERIIVEHTNEPRTRETIYLIRLKYVKVLR